MTQASRFKSWPIFMAGFLLAVAGGVAFHYARAPARAGVAPKMNHTQSVSGGAPADGSSLLVPESVDQTPEPVLTREEKRFLRYDRSHDQRISVDEFLAARRKAFAKLDRDGDGKLRFEEYAAKAMLKFDSADANRDHALDATEFATTARPAAKTKRRNCPPEGAPTESEPAAHEP